MPEVDRISPDQDESVSSEPLGIKEPLRSPTALGQSRFLMPLGLRSLSVLQSIAVHPQVDDFDFSSVQAAEPTPFQEPSSPNLQLFSFPEPRDEQSAPFDIPAKDRFERSEDDRSVKGDRLQQKPSTSPTPHPGTSRPQPVQGVVQFFKSVFGRKDSPAPEQTSTPEFLSVADSPQPLSTELPLVQLQRDTTTPAEPPQATLSSELASSFFFDRSKAASQNLLDLNLETLQQTEDLPEIAATSTVLQQVSGSRLEILQREKDDENNASEDASFPSASSQAPLQIQKNVDTLSVDSQALVSADDLEAIAPSQFNSENAPDLEPQKIISEDSLIPALRTIQLRQEDKTDQGISPLFSQDKTSSENLIYLSETTEGETDLEKSLAIEEVSASENEPGESSQIQRQSAEQSTDSVQFIAPVENSTGVEQVIEPALSNQQITATEDYAQTNQNSSVIQTKNDEPRIQDQLEIQRRNNDVLSTQDEISATNSISPLLNDVEINTLQTKQEDSLEEISSLEADAAKQPETIQSSFPFPSTQVEEPSRQISIPQPTEESAKNETERAIAFIPEDFVPEIEQQEILQPSFQLREAHPSTETSGSLPESVASPESITPASPPQLQQSSVRTETTTASHEIISSAETLPVSQPNRGEEPAILQTKSDADTSLNPHPFHDASAISDQGASSTSLDVSLSYNNATLTPHDTSALNPKTLSIREDISSTDHTISSIVDYSATSDLQERLTNDASPNVLQLREEKAETLDLPFQESPQTLLPEDLSTSSKSPLQDWDAVEVVPLASPEIQRQAENARFTDAAGAISEAVLLPEKIASLEEKQVGSKNTAVQNQSDINGDRQSFISTNQNLLEPIELDASIRSASPQDLNIQRHPTTENIQAITQQNSAPIWDKSYPGILPDSSIEVDTSSELIELEARSLQSISNESALPPNAPVTETLSSPEVQRQPENSVIKSDIVSRRLPGTEAENHSESEIGLEARSLQPISNESALPPNAPITETLSSPEIQRQLENFVSKSDIDSRRLPGTEAENHSESEIELEARSLPVISNESPPSAPITETLSSPEIQRQLENSVSTSHVVSEEFFDIEAETYSENEILSTSANDSDVFTKPLMSESLQSEEHSEPGILSAPVNDSGAFIEPSTLDSLQLKSEQADELAVSSDLQNISVAESFEHSSESSAALNHPGSEPHFLENPSDPSAQFTSNIPSVQAASDGTDDTEGNCNLAGKSISGSIEFVPDSVALSSTELAIAPSTSEPLSRASQFDHSESSEFTHPLTDSISNTLDTPSFPNIQRRIESSEPAIQSPTLPNNGTLQAETQLNPGLQSVAEQNDSSLQISFSANPQRPSQDLPQSPLDLGNVTFHAAPTEEEILSPVQPSSLALEGESEILPHSIIQREPYAGDESNHPETFISSELSHPGSNTQSFVEDTSDALNQSVAIPTVQATSISSSSASATDTHGLHKNVAVEINNLDDPQPVSEAIAQEQHENQNLLPSKDRFAESPIASHPIKNLDPLLTIAAKPEFDTAIQQRSLENTDHSSALAESEILSPVLPSTSVEEGFASSEDLSFLAGEQQSERLDPSNSAFLENSPGAQQSEHVETASHAFSASSPNIQLELESRSSIEGLRPELSESLSEPIAPSFNEPLVAFPITERSAEVIAPSSIEPSTTFPVKESSSEAIAPSSIDTELSSEAIAPSLIDAELSSEAIAPSFNKPSIALPVTELSSEAITPSSIKPSTTFPVKESSSEAVAPSSIDTELSSEAIAPSFNEPSIALPVTESSSEAIALSSSESSTAFPAKESSSEAVAPSSIDTELFSEPIAPSSSEPSIALPVKESSSEPIAPSFSEPSIALPVTELSSEAIAPSSIEYLPAFPATESSSESVAPSSSEPSIALPVTESSSEAIGNPWDASSSYNSTPNGRRDARLAAPEEQLSVENEIQVLPNALSSDVQRFVDDSLEHSSAAAQLNSNDQSEQATPSSSELPADLPQLPRFLQNLTVLKPLVQRSPHTLTPENIASESVHADALNVLSGNSSEAIAQTFSESAIAIPSPEQPDQAIGNTWNSSSSYDSTPNGRRDMQHNVSENPSTVEGPISPVVPNPLDSNIQRFADNNFDPSSSTQPDSSDQSEAVNFSDPQLSADFPQLPRFLQDLTVLKPLVQRSPLTATFASVHADPAEEPALASSSEAIAQTTSKPAIEFSSLSVEPSPVESSPVEPLSQASANTWNAASSYDSTPNGRRDAQIAASENHSPAESLPVLPNSSSSDIQRFIDDSSEHSSFFAQPSTSEQSETVKPSSSQLSADLPQLPKFLQDLTVLKPLVQRSLQVTSEESPLHESPEDLFDESPSHSTLRSLPSSSPVSGSRTPQSANVHPVSTPAQTPSSAPLPPHPGTAPSTWSSLAELVSPKPGQPQQSSSTNYSPLAPSLLQAKFVTPTLQRAIESSAPIEVPNAPTTTLSSSDFQQEVPLDALLETLAQEIYGLLRQKMEIERERQGRSLGRMPW